MMFWRSKLTYPKTAPRPIFRLGNEIGTQGISLGIPDDLIKILVALNGEGFVSALVNMAVPNHVVILLPTCDMRYGQSLHKRAQIAVVFWPENKMPVIGHKAIAHNPHRSLFERLDNHSLEGQVIVVTEKQRLLAHASIDDMINHSSWSNARGPRHTQNRPNRDSRVKKLDLSPFSFVFFPVFFPRLPTPFPLFSPVKNPVLIL